jgi:L-threonylcarbamoyladenylate synthase
MLGDKIEIILDGGPTQVGLESTVLDICHGQARILRPGGVPKEAIEAVIGPLAEGPASDGIAVNDTDISDTDGADIYGAAIYGTAIYGDISPGMMKSHYAPQASLEVYDFETLIQIPAENGSAFLFFDNASYKLWQKKQKLPLEKSSIKILSETGNITEAAAHFFQSLHELDKSGISRIYAQSAPEEGLGVAINDRLQRAKQKKSEK